MKLYAKPVAAMAATGWLAIAASSWAGIVGSVVNPSSSGYGLMPRPTAISVCFYGDALTSRTARAQEIQGLFTGHTSAAANLVFTGFGTCAAPTTGTCGSPPHACDQYSGDIRIALDGTSIGGTAVQRQIPASFADCDDHGAWSSWSQFPDPIDTSARRACPYTTAIGDDADSYKTPPVPWLNHPLHEAGGHGMGLIHEFEQAGYYNFVGPNGAICSNSLGVPSGSSHPEWYVSLTPADAYSVMMYQQTDCGIDGNYGMSGYSALDKVTLHILYPENVRAAEYVGTTVVPVNTPVHLRQLWFAQGANSDVVSSLLWSIGGTTSSAGDLSATWTTAGTRTGTLTYNDFLGRSYTTSIEVRVVNADQYPSVAVLPGIRLLAL